MSEVIGRRVIAAFLDGILCFCLAAAVGDALELGTHYTARQLRRTFPATSFIRDGLLVLVIVVLYWGCCEAVWRRTPGKALFNLRVVDLGGQRASGRQVAIRSILRIIDILPAVYLLGFVTILVTGHRGQRIGDLVAHTRVVAEQ